MESRELSNAEWRSKAETYCARAEHCTSELRRKWEQWGAPDDLFDEIVESLYQNDFLNDARFCQSYVHDKLEFQHWGRVKIRAMLKGLGLPDGAIRDALDSIDEAQYTTILRQTADLRRGASKEQLYRFLLQRGFSYDEIKKLHG